MQCVNFRCDSVPRVVLHAHMLIRADTFPVEIPVRSHAAESNSEGIVGFQTVPTSRAGRRRVCGVPYLIGAVRMGSVGRIRHIGRVRSHGGSPILGRSTSDRCGRRRRHGLTAHVRITLGSLHATPSDSASSRSRFTPWGAAVESVADKLGIGTAQTLLNWTRRAQTDAGQRPGVTSEIAAEMRKLRAETGNSSVPTRS